MECPEFHDTATLHIYFFIYYLVTYHFFFIFSFSYSTFIPLFIYDLFHNSKYDSNLAAMASYILERNGTHFLKGRKAMAAQHHSDTLQRRLYSNLTPTSAIRPATMKTNDVFHFPCYLGSMLVLIIFETHLLIKVAETERRR